MSKIQALENYSQQGLNIKTGSFLGTPIFKISYEKDRELEWGPPGDTKLVKTPDQVRVSNSTSSHSQYATNILKTKADYDRSYSMSIDAEYSGIVYSGSASGSLFYHGSLFSSSSLTYGLNTHAQEVLNFQRSALDSDKLEQKFIDSVNKLPEEISSEEDKEKYFKLFEEYGTHYVHYGILGSTIFMETQIQDSLLETNTKLQISTAIDIGFNGMISSGKVSSSSAYSNNEFLEHHKNSLRIKISTLGGYYTEGESLDDWKKSIYGTPILVVRQPNTTQSTKTTLYSIANLLQHIIEDKPKREKIKSNIESLTGIYVTNDEINDGLLTSPTSFKADKNYNSEYGDGFVMATIRAKDGASEGWLDLLSGNSDASDTIRIRSSMCYTSIPPFLYRDLLSTSAMMPVAKGTSYLCQPTDERGSPTVHLSYTGLGEGMNTSLGEWEDISDKISNNENSDLITFDTDGFIVAYVDGQSVNGSRSEIRGYQNLDGELQLIAAASQHYETNTGTNIPCNSFTMSIVKGESYRLLYKQELKDPLVKAYFIPFSNPQFKLFNPQDRFKETEYVAQSDGFLIACINAKFNGERGEIQMYSYNAEGSHLDKLGWATSTSGQYQDASNTIVSVNSAMIPVAKGDHYKVKVSSEVGSPEISIKWVPLNRV